MFTAIRSPEAPTVLEFDVEMLERFRRTWQPLHPESPRAEDTVACDTVVNCTETDECVSVVGCSAEDCTNASCTVC